MSDSETCIFSIPLIWITRDVGWRVSPVNGERNGMYKEEHLCSLEAVGVFHLCTEGHAWFDNKMISAVVIIWDITLSSDSFMCLEKEKSSSLLNNVIDYKIHSYFKGVKM